ncbi:chloride channel protein [Methanofollis aquaemaris]|uniref:Chloride channel protein n=1 Tax=Methanofollis aquaemaris TaxID=126734 RepID=A0A8A3S2F6_9EURY|nr:chloride channel protein [Methanofollis aquaemaris]QSZ66365.1 chloride channel protein [Methanofollis aquaemaris]
MPPDDPAAFGHTLRFALAAVLLAVAAAGAMVLFLAVQYGGVALIWPESPPVPYFTLLLTTAGGLAVGLCLHLFGDHVGLLQETLATFKETGRFEPQYLPAGLLTIYLSLVGGASLGPEVAAVDMGGGMGTRLGDRVAALKDRVRDLSTVGFLGCLVGFAIYLLLTGPPGALYPVPPYKFVAVDLLYATVLGLVGAAAGVGFIYSYHLFARLVAPLADRPLLRGLLGGLGLGILGTLAPLVLFSGQTQFQTVLAEGAAMGAVVLIGIVAAKILASTWCMATVFKGGPVFPLFFAGGTLGMAASLLAPGVPVALAVPAAMAGMTVAVLKMPSVVLVLLAMVFLQWDIVPAVVIATLVGYAATRGVVLIERG